MGIFMHLLRNSDPNSLEAELVSIHKIVRSLEPLRTEQRIKVLEYALTHLGLSLEVAGSLDSENEPTTLSSGSPVHH